MAAAIVCVEFIALSRSRISDKKHIHAHSQKRKMTHHNDITGNKAVSSEHFTNNEVLGNCRENRIAYE